MKETTTEHCICSDPILPSLKTSQEKSLTTGSKLKNDKAQKEPDNFTSSSKNNKVKIYLNSRTPGSIHETHSIVTQSKRIQQREKSLRNNSDSVYIKHQHRIIHCH